jgi:UDP-2-acetamido-2,6-beta-L-arabino-hexul-4-ose reductase
MIKLGVTGANGFIGKSISSCFNELEGFEVEEINLPIDRFLDCDVVFHCAGINRPRVNETFDLNVELTENLISFVPAGCRLVFMSSIQAATSNPYGISKLGAEKLVKIHDNWSILRLPNIFGAGCKPHYNSVVATFCKQAVSGEPHVVNNPNHMLQLLWIEHLVDFCVNLSFKHTAMNQIVSFDEAVAKLSVQELSELILKIYQDLKMGYVRSVERTFRWQLETTLLSYFEEPLIRVMDPIKDDKGIFCELLKTDNGQVSFLKCDIGEERGLHYHRAKYERFFVLSGDGVFRSKHVNGDVTEVNLHSNEVIEVTTIPHHIHSIKNIGRNELVVLIWANEIFNHRKPDTFKGLI